MSKVYCANCKYYDFNSLENIDWCRLNNEETGICGHCEREFENLEEATEHYESVVEENDKLWSQNADLTKQTNKLQKLINFIDNLTKKSDVPSEDLYLIKTKIQELDATDINVGGIGESR